VGRSSSRGELSSEFRLARAPAPPVATKLIPYPVVRTAFCSEQCHIEATWRKTHTMQPALLTEEHRGRSANRIADFQPARLSKERGGRIFTLAQNSILPCRRKSALRIKDCLSTTAAFLCVCRDGSFMWDSSCWNAGR